MAKVKNGPLGHFSGKVGPFVYYTIYGKECVRTKPTASHSKKSKAQLIQQEKMRLVNAFVIPFKTLFRGTLYSVSKGRSPYHSALSLNLKAALSTDASDALYFDFSKAVLSVGPLTLPDVVEVQRTGNTCHFVWNTGTGNPTDSVVVMVYQPNPGIADYGFTGIQRSVGQLTWKFPLHTTPCHLWIAFRSKDERLMSNSLYAGKR